MNPKPTLTTLHWLGGWASSLACWEPMLRERFPGFEHRFYDSNTLLEAVPSDLGFPELRGHHIVVAWSMGTLLAHGWIEKGWWPLDLPLLSLCPVFRFIGPGRNTEAVLVRMEEKLNSNRKAVLRDFWRHMPKAQVAPAAWEEAWVNGTRKHGNDELIRGLEFLRSTEVHPEALHRTPRHWELLVGLQDTLAPVGPWANTLPPQATLTHYAGGHLPFWECPEVLLAALRRLSPNPLESMQAAS